MNISFIVNSISKRHFFLFVVFLLSKNVFSQDTYLPPSPTSADLIRALSNNVDMYTGRAGIAVPITSLQERSLNAEISLKYIGAGGIKIVDVAGPVGLGWALSAGGVITRTVRGKVDEQPEGYCVNDKSGKLRAVINSADYKDAFKSQDLDLEADIFSSSMGGRIVFDPDKTPHFLENASNVILQNGVFSPDSTWIIVDGKGTKYVFGKNASDREHINTHTGYGTENLTYTSSWYLSEIVSNDGLKIEFNYEKTNSVTHTFFSQSYTLSQPTSGGGTPSDSYNDVTTTRTILDPVRLKSIKTSNQKAVFNYVNRWDSAGDKAVESIIVYDNQNVMLDKYSLKLGYFKNSSAEEYSRLKLIGIDKYNKNDNQIIHIAKFVYNEVTNLPKRDSKQFDHWGYYNNNSVNSSFVSDGADRSPDLEKTKSNVLTSIETATGSKIEYEYELNNHLYNNIEKNVGGLRVKKIKETDNTSTKTTLYTYTLTDGKTSGLLHSNFDESNGYVFNYDSSYQDPNNNTVLVNNFVETSMPAVKIFDFNNINVGYSRVTVEVLGNGKEVYQFSDYNLYPDVVDAIVGSHTFQVGTFYSNIAYDPTRHRGVNSCTSNSFMRGLIREKEVFNNIGQPLKKVTNIYLPKVVYSIPMASRLPFGPLVPGSSYYSLYTEKTAVPQLSRSVEADYDIVTGQWAEKLTRYEYNAIIPSLSRKTVESLSSLDSLVTTYKYAVDINTGSDAIIAKMVTSNIQAPVETVKIKKKSGTEFVDGATLVLYSNFNNIISGNVLPSKILTLKVNSIIGDYNPLSSMTSYDSRCTEDLNFNYGSKGELLEFRSPQGKITSIVWDKAYTKELLYVENSVQSRIVLDNMESNYSAGNWDIRNVTSTNGDSYSGTMSGYISHCSKTLSHGDYIVEYKFKGNPLNISGSNLFTISSHISTADPKGWKTYSAVMAMTGSGSLTVVGSGTPDQVIDDFLIYPQEAHATVFTYDAGNNMLSTTDKSGITTFYEYDDFSRLRAVRDQKYNITKQISYNYRDVSKWQDTQIRRCLVAPQGWYSGEEEISQIDINPQSPTFNQTRWRSLGNTNRCSKTVYAKLFLEDVLYTDDGGPPFTFAKVIVRFYEDYNCTVPYYVRPINVYVNGYPVLCHGTSTLIHDLAIPGHVPLDFVLSANGDYIIVP